MGQIFQKTNTSRPALLLQLKSIKIRDLFDSLDIIDQFYPQAVYLNKEQFEDVFSGLTSLYDELFELIAERDVASTFEMLAAMSIFSGETYETKCAFIFRLFDFDVSNTLDREEMNRTLQCVCRAMCKVSGLACPSHRALVQLADVCFQMMDTDRNHHVDYGEWYQWTSENEELQEFLLQHTGTQTYVHAKKRMAQMTTFAENEFMQLGKDESQVAATQLKDLLKGLYPNRDVTALFTIMVEYSLRMKALGMQSHRQLSNEVWEWKSDTEVGQRIFTNLMIKRLDFLDVIKAWISYITVDIHDDSQLSTTEIRTLLWIYEDDEPDYFKVTQVHQEIDPQRTGIVARTAWMEYLCSEDAILKRVLYNSMLKKTFDKFDEHGTGFLPVPVASDLLKSYFKEQLRTLKDMRSVESLYNILDTVTHEIQQEMVALEISEFTWFQFHHLLVSSTQKYPSLSQLLEHK